MEEPAQTQTFSEPVPSNHVRMEFTGQRAGAVTYQGKAGRSYRFGRGISHRFKDVHRDDVDRLLSLGMFRVVERASEAAPAPPKPAPKPITPEEAAAALMQAKAEAAEALSALPMPVAEEAPQPKAKRGRKSKKSG